MQLDAKTIAGLALPDGKTDAIFFDELVPGFGHRLRLGSDGRLRRSWVAQYRSHGRTRRLKIGTEKLSPDEARKAARKALAKVELGGDPQGDKVKARLAAVHTLRSVVDAYLEARKPELRPASYKATALYLTGPRYFGPLHTTSITKITHPDVAARLTAIKHASGEVTAKQARGALSTLYKWAMGEGLMGTSPFNPVIGTNVPAASIPRERVLHDGELVAIWRACEDDDFGRIVRLLILLGSRRGEVGGMRATEIDLDASSWFLPAARSKNGHAMLVPLPPAALQIIKACPRADRDQLFGSRAKSGFTEWYRGKHQLDARLGNAVAPWRLHDLRRTAATRMGDLGVLPHVIEAALNHRSGAKRGIAGIYNKSPYQRDVATALVLWSEHILALIEDREDKVVALRA